MAGPTVRAALAVLMACSATVVSAKDFGAHGALFDITEPDFLEEIISRFRTMEEDGGMAQMERDMQARTRGYIARPNAAALLEPAEEYRAFEFDPSIILDRDLMDQHGQVFARAGERINPLEHSRFEQRIVFIDGDVPEQVAFALEEGDELNTLIVITKGAPLDLTRQAGRRFWFDQGGVMVKRFGLVRLPSVVTRADPVMLIEEIPLAELVQ